MECKHCKSELSVLKFYTKQIVYCTNCLDYKIEYISCDHDMRYILFKLENESLQLRRLCIKCYYRDPKIYKQVPELLRMAIDKKEIDFQIFKSFEIDEEPLKINRFIEDLINRK